MPLPTADHLSIPQDEFRGLYSRGKSDNVPSGYFQDCLNNKFGEGEVSSRDGLVLNLTKGNIVRFFVYKRLSENSRFIFLDTSGNLIDSLSPGTPIWTDASIVDFSMVNYSNRAYITVHNRVKGVAGKFILVYQGSGMARLAAGPPPSGYSITATNSATVGHVEAGIHLFGIANITDSGFITGIGPEVFVALAAVGGKKATISGINPGPTGVVERIVVATKAIPAGLFTGNQFGYEFFFVPGATIPDNISTSIDVSFYDADLQNSADYLFDNLASIPAGVGIGVYAGRLMVWGEDGHQFTVRFSNALQPEVFSSVVGFFTIDPSDAESGVRNCAVFRKNLVVTTVNRIYSTSDNGSDPSTWNIDEVDLSVGVECFGINTVLDARGTNNDRMFIATKSGAISYEGFAKKPEISFLIEDTWARINKKKFNLVQIVDDPPNHRLLIAVPLDNATTLSHILYADYSRAHTVWGTLDETKFKWSIWSFPSAPVSIMGDVDAVSGDTVIHVALAAGNIYDMVTDTTNDFGNAIDSFIQLGPKTVLNGWINHFGAVKLRMWGSGNMQINLTGEDGVLPQNLLPLALSANPGFEPYRIFNFINEKCSLKLRTSLFGEHYTISSIILFAKALWIARPN